MALSGKMQINHSRVKTAVTQVLLDTADIDTGFQKMGGIAMSQGMDRDPLFDVKLLEYSAKSPLCRAVIHGLFCCGAFIMAMTQPGKNPGGIAVKLPVFS